MAPTTSIVKPEYHYEAVNHPAFLRHLFLLRECGPRRLYTNPFKILKVGTSRGTSQSLMLLSERLDESTLTLLNFVEALECGVPMF